MYVFCEDFPILFELFILALFEPNTRALFVSIYSVHFIRLLILFMLSCLPFKQPPISDTDRMNERYESANVA